MVESQQSPFSHASITCLENTGTEPSLGFSRAYSISLSPQLVYTRSNLLPALVSSKVYRQLEFLAVGSWWIYGSRDSSNVENEAVDQEMNRSGPKNELSKIPGGREDVFTDKSIDLRSTRSLMRFLKLAADFDTHSRILQEWGEKSFPDFLTSYIKVPLSLQPLLLALTLSPNPPARTSTSYALPRIHRHLTSIGMFGPGFGSVIPKWGGLAEIAQVACRAGAVGGGVYVLKKCLEGIDILEAQTPDKEVRGSDRVTQLLTARLEGGDEIKTRWIVGSHYNLPRQNQPASDYQTADVFHNISIVSSPLSSLFPIPAEGSPPPAGVVVVFPTVPVERISLHPVDEQPPVYLMIHSSDTGECPVGQCKDTLFLSQPQPLP